MTNTPHDTLNALRLIRSDGVGPATYNRLVATFGSVEATLARMPHMKKPLQPADPAPIEKEYAALTKLGGRFLVKDTQSYPQALEPFDDAPPVLAALGNTDLLNRPMIAMIGARNASVGGRKMATQLARELGDAGYVVVSGLARGIDACAHEAALETGTIAVLANGVDVVYPPENKKLYNAIREKGLLLSENALGLEPSASLFPRRNRIISGLSCAVILIEAAAKSGSLITARFALDQGRDVFAVPGHPFDPRSTGGNGLIKTGQAQLIESVQDVLDALGILHQMPALPISTAPAQQEILFDPAPNAAPATPSHTDDQSRQAIMECLSHAPCSIDHIALATRLPVSRILTVLMEFELAGRITRLAGDRVALS